MGIEEKTKTSYEIFLLWNEQVDKSEWVRLETVQQLRKDLTDEIHRLDAEVAQRNVKIAGANKIIDSYYQMHSVSTKEYRLICDLRKCLAGETMENAKSS